MRTQPIGSVSGFVMLIAGRQIAVYIERAGIGENVVHVMRRRLSDDDPRSHRHLIVLDHTRVHHGPHGHRDDWVETQALHEEAVRDVN